MEYDWGTIKSLIQDKMRSAAFTSDYVNEVQRAFNLGLDRINAGDIGEKNSRMVGFEFQKEIVSVSYSTVTGHNYTFSTLSIDSNTFKFPNDLRINSDEDIHFTFVNPNYWYRKHGVRGSVDSIYTITFDGNTRTLKILHDTTETLDFEIFTTDMVLDDNGSTRRAHIDGGSDDDTLLIPDQFIDVPLSFCISELYGQKKGYMDPECLRFEQAAQNGLRTMINSLGTYQRMPVQGISIRGEWNTGLIKIKRS